LRDSTFKFNTSVNYQIINKQFDPIERFRNVEFDRDWNLTNLNQNQTENMANVTVNLSKNKLGLARYNVELMNRDNGFNGIRNNFMTTINEKGYFFNFDGSLLNTSDKEKTTSFLRHKTTLSKKVKIITVGVREEQENNLWEKISFGFFTGK